MENIKNLIKEYSKLEGQGLRQANKQKDILKEVREILDGYSMPTLKDPIKEDLEIGLDIIRMLLKKIMREN